MAGKISNDGYVDDLNAWLGIASPPGLVCRLYTNNFTPVLGMTPSNFTEVGVSGYTAQGVSPSAWSSAVVSGQVQFTCAALTFTLAAAVTIYGYYVTDVGNTKVEWAELGSGGPFVFGAGGGTLVVTLQAFGPAPGVEVSF